MPSECCGTYEGRGIRRLGASEGIEYRAAVQAALAAALFDAYFRDGVNIADHKRLTELAERAGLDGGRVRDFLASEEGNAEVREQVAAARRAR